MKSSRICIVASLFACFFPATTTVAQTENVRQMVLTIDDLPYHASGHPDTIAQANRVTDRLLSTLTEYQAPATAFVNESNLLINGEADARTRLLRKWAESGVILGNHTYSHADLNQSSVELFQREIIDGESITLEVMLSRPRYQRYFRYPYSHTGDTAEKKARIARFLKERGYRIAPYTIDSQDYVFNRIYLDARQSENVELAEQIRLAYVEFVVAATVFAETISSRVFGDEIPQILIVHANQINADALAEVLARLVQRGYLFVDLTKAMQHPAYKTEDRLVTSYGPSWLWRWSYSMELDISFRGDPEPPNWILDLYEESVSVDD